MTTSDLLADLDISWRTALAAQWDSETFRTLSRFVDEAYRNETVYPPQDLIFAAFNHTPVSRVKVVLIGQDPYHNPGQAHGLSFSVPEGCPLPPSLVNIYKELEAEYRTPFLSRSGDLTAWAEQGVLLLNATLTVTGGANTAGSHQKKGWEQITDAAIRHLSETREGLVYFLWGNAAQKKASLIDATRNLVLCAAHPSPLSAYRGFFGCNHFVKCNAYLAARGETPIAW